MWKNSGLVLYRLPYYFRIYRKLFGAMSKVLGIVISLAHWNRFHIGLKGGLSYMSPFVRTYTVRCTYCRHIILESASRCVPASSCERLFSLTLNSVRTDSNKFKSKMVWKTALKLIRIVWRAQKRRATTTDRAFTGNFYTIIYTATKLHSYYDAFIERL